MPIHFSFEGAALLLLVLCLLCVLFVVKKKSHQHFLLVAYKLTKKTKYTSPPLLVIPAIGENAKLMSSLRHRFAILSSSDIVSRKKLGLVQYLRHVADNSLLLYSGIFDAFSQALKPLSYFWWYMFTIT